MSLNWYSDGYRALALEDMFLYKGESMFISVVKQSIFIQGSKEWPAFGASLMCQFEELRLLTFAFSALETAT